MEKRKMAVVVAVAFSLAMTGVCAQSCNESRIPRQSAATAVSAQSEPHISFVTAGLDINWLGKATCDSYVSCYPNTTKCQIVSELQQFKDGQWRIIASWDTIGTTAAEALNTKYVSKGYTYRVVSTGYAYVGNTCVESLYALSKEVDY